MFSGKIHRYIFLFGACSLGFGMMIGAVPTSIPQIILLGNWLLEGRFRSKWESLRKNKLFWLLISVFLIHLVGLLYSTDLAAAINDVKIKMPLFFLPLIFFSTQPLSKKEFHALLLCFLLGSLSNTLWCLAYSFLLYHNETGRDSSRFMSHIRLGLYLNMAIAGCIYFAFHVVSRLRKAACLILALYFLFCMFALGLASGLSQFLILCLVSCIVLLYSAGRWVKVSAIAACAGICIAGVGYVIGIKKEQLDVHRTANNTIRHFNAGHHEYVSFDLSDQQKENGNYVMINIQPHELRKEWKRQFPADSFNFNSVSHNANRYAVLLRYLASKGFNKDSAAIAQLTETDKANILKNITNYRYPQWSFLHKRVYELVNEYDEFAHHRTVNGHSLTMRLYFWKAAVHAIEQHILIGAGTGDVQQEMDKAYAETHSPLEKEWYKRPHNQFLSFTVAFGLTGLLLFLLSLIIPALQLKKHLHILFWPFFVLAFISFFMEDTLESQAGLTFYAVFSTLFLSTAWFAKKEEQARDL